MVGDCWMVREIIDVDKEFFSSVVIWPWIIGMYRRDDGNLQISFIFQDQLDLNYACTYGEDINGSEAL